MRIFAIGLAVALSTTFLVGTRASQEKKEDAPKFTISEVMKKAHAGKDALRTKVLKGEATDEEKTQLTALYVALAQATPPKGDVDAWKKRTKDILDAWKSGDLKAYEKATNCGACHDKFKKKKDE